MTHLTWSVEKGDNCGTCGEKTVLAVAPTFWTIDTEDGDGEVEVYDEVSGHYCRKCGRLVSLSLNTID